MSQAESLASPELGGPPQPSALAPAERRFVLAYTVISAAALLIPLAGLAQEPFGQEIYQSAFLLGLLTLTLVSWRLRKDGRLRQCLIVWGPLMAVSGLAALLSDAPLHSLAALASFTLRGAAVAVLLQGCLTYERARRVTLALTIVAALAALNGIVEAVVGFNIPWEPLYSSQSEWDRYLFVIRGGVLGTSGHPLPYAVMLSMFVPVALSLPVRRPLRLALGGVMTLAVILSVSRAGLLSVAIGVTFVRLFGNTSGQNWRRRLKPAVFALIGAIMLWGFLASTREGIRFARSLTHESHRWTGLELTRNVLRDHPVLGLGPGRFPEHYLQYRPPTMEKSLPTPDNQYLRWTMETGILGFASLVWLYAIEAWTITHAMRETTAEHRRLLAGVAGGLLGGAAALAFFDGFVWMPTHFAFWSLTGIALALCANRGVQASHA